MTELSLTGMSSVCLHAARRLSSTAKEYTASLEAAWPARKDPLGHTSRFAFSELYRQVSLSMSDA